MSRSPTKSGIDDSRCQWLGTARSASSRKNDTIASVTQFNNSWYKSADGERAKDLGTKGVISPERHRQRPAWDRQDMYTKKRNPANDGKRYTYIDDCSDEIRRDVVLRFAVPPHMPSRVTGPSSPILPNIHQPRASDTPRNAAASFEATRGPPPQSQGTAQRFTMNGTPLASARQ